MSEHHVEAREMDEAEEVFDVVFPSDDESAEVVHPFAYRVWGRKNVTANAHCRHVLTSVTTSRILAVRCRPTKGMTMNNTIQAIKRIVKGVPGFNPFLLHLRERRWNSSNYWDRRYRRGGTSGAGSYNRLAEFKATFLNGFVEQWHIASVIEFGSGDGSQLKLARYAQYIGVDVSAKAVELCRSTFSGDTSKAFFHSRTFVAGTTAALTLSLDVVYHLVEDDIYEAYMRQLFRSAERFVIVYSSNVAQDTMSIHIRHRRFTDWVEQNERRWYLHATVKNAYPYDAADPEHTSFADFYIFSLKHSLAPQG
jgi:hypothetical protein